ncbi:glycyl-radical enzyme activating protein [Victivallis vadensis]|uniref:glycyl-radical enzyme activating protein n=1 Tax=Victivallis vadensis TaxID=172901 RepID=UPI0026DDA44B|nr:glycyl-radical enzyme activating protein [Victivallis vadensis]
MLNIEALLADVKPLAVHDGPGLRTTFFLKGCPLRCRWCHNPECISPRPQLLYREKFCADCGNCVPACPAGAHRIGAGGHRFERERCIGCDSCETACLHGALQLCGRRITVEKALELALEDRDFQRRSGGGVTVSGGEPLLQTGFCRAFFMELGKLGVHRALDTSGEAPWETLELLLAETDLVLYDFKQADDAKHRAGTGVSNRRILENLRRLTATGIPVEIRIPLIPGYNMEQEDLEKAGRFLAGVPQPPPVRLLAYHPFAHEKYRFAGRSDTLQDADPPEDAEMESAAGILRSFGLKVLW